MRRGTQRKPRRMAAFPKSQNPKITVPQHARRGNERKPRRVAAFPKFQIPRITVPQHARRGNERKPRRVAALSGVTICQVAIGGWHCLALDAGAATTLWHLITPSWLLYERAEV